MSRISSPMEAARRQWWDGLSKQGDPMRIVNPLSSGFRAGWEAAESTNAELLRLLERHHKESLARDILLPEDAEHYSGTELYWATVGATRPAEAAIERAKEKV